MNEHVVQAGVGFRPDRDSMAAVEVVVLDRNVRHVSYACLWRNHVVAIGDIRVSDRDVVRTGRIDAVRIR